MVTLMGVRISLVRRELKIRLRKSSTTTEPVLSISHNIPPLPVEILLHITSYAQGDFTVLSTLARTSSSWHSASIPYIFQEVIIGSTQRLVEFSDLLKADPQITPSVHRLSLHFVFEPEKLDLVRALAIIGRLPNLQFLTLHNRYSMPYSRMGQNILEKLPLLPSITHLSLVGSFHPVVGMAFGSAFPNIRDLSMAETSIQRHPNDQDGRLQHSGVLRLTSLRLDWFAPLCVPLENTLVQVLSSESKKTLRSVSIPVCFDDLQIVGQFLRELSSSLEHLELTFVRMVASQERLTRFPRWDMDTFKKELDLTHMATLRSFTFHYFQRSNTRDYAKLVSIASLLPWKQLRRLTVHLYFGLASNYTEFFSPLLDVVSSERFKTLEEVNFVYTGPLRISLVSKTLRDSFPALHAQGIMHIECSCVGVCEWDTTWYHRRKYL